ncbi:MAG: phosphonate C-P lyase system protein PhnH [Desulfitobacterium sp.]
MSLDFVHDIQAVYRETIDAMARPGSLHSIQEQAEKVEIACGCLKATVLLALMLLDTEVRFKVVSEQEAELTKILNQLTYAKATAAEAAQFILITVDAEAAEVEQALQAAYVGSLLNPHHSATVIFEVKGLSTEPTTDGAGEQGLILSGPGIQRESFICVRTPLNWIELRAQKNKEYPLGIDFIFVDPDHRMFALPRTTKIQKQEIR